MATALCYGVRRAAREPSEGRPCQLGRRRRRAHGAQLGASEQQPQHGQRAPWQYMGHYVVHYMVHYMVHSIVHPVLEHFGIVVRSEYDHRTLGA